MLFVSELTVFCSHTTLEEGRESHNVNSTSSVVVEHLAVDKRTYIVYVGMIEISGIVLLLFCRHCINMGVFCHFVLCFWYFWSLYLMKLIDVGLSNMEMIFFYLLKYRDNNEIVRYCKCSYTKSNSRCGKFIGMLELCL